MPRNKDEATKRLKQSDKYTMDLTESDGDLMAEWEPETPSTTTMCTTSYTPPSTRTRAPATCSRWHCPRHADAGDGAARSRLNNERHQILAIEHSEPCEHGKEMDSSGEKLPSKIIMNLDLEHTIKRGEKKKTARIHRLRSSRADTEIIDTRRRLHRGHGPRSPRLVAEMTATSCRQDICSRWTATASRRSA